MRNEFAAAALKSFDAHKNLVFVTGDLGYMALEKVQEKFGERFINAGVAEQNMVSVAAALAHEGFIPLVYSISPFVTLRPYEQLRNDVCLHRLPVKIVANGGGFGYGIMGATHHDIEDIGAMRILPNMKVFVPCVASDVNEAVEQMLADPNPNYLRMNMAANLGAAIAPFAPWRKIKEGSKAVVIGTGPVIESICTSRWYEELEIWVASIFPLHPLPDGLVACVNKSRKVITIEEHRGECGLRETLSYHLLNLVDHPIRMLSLSAEGYPSGRYGDQKWHQEENSLRGAPLERKLETFLN